MKELRGNRHCSKPNEQERFLTPLPILWVLGYTYVGGRIRAELMVIHFYDCKYPEDWTGAEESLVSFGLLGPLTLCIYMRGCHMVIGIISLHGSLC